MQLDLQIEIKKVEEFDKPYLNGFGEPLPWEVHDDPSGNMAVLGSSNPILQANTIDPVLARNMSE